MALVSGGTFNLTGKITLARIVIINKKLYPKIGLYRHIGLHMKI